MHVWLRETGNGGRHPHRRGKIEVRWRRQVLLPWLKPCVKAGRLDSLQLLLHFHFGSEWRIFAMLCIAAAALSRQAFVNPARFSC